MSNEEDELVPLVTGEAEAGGEPLPMVLEIITPGSDGVFALSPILGQKRVETIIEICSDNEVNIKHTVF